MNDNGLLVAKRPMSRTLLLFLVGVLVTCAAVAAPAPPSPWQQGWDKPVEPGGCKFRYAGAKLTIEVPGGCQMYEDTTPLVRTCPRLVQTIAGDFIAQVRVRGDFHPKAEAVRDRCARVSAGLVLLPDEGEFVWVALQKAHIQNSWRSLPGLHIISPGTIDFSEHDGKETYLRLERMGNEVCLSFSTDGSRWIKMEPCKLAALPLKVKIGVFAASTSTIPFKPRFDKFKLTRKGQ